MLELAIQRQIELVDERFFECEVPGGVEGTEVAKHGADAHPVEHFLIFRDVADGGEVAAGEMARVDAEDLRAAGSGAEDVHKELYERGLPCSVCADEGIDGAVRDGEADAADCAR